MGFVTDLFCVGLLSYPVLPFATSLHSLLIISAYQYCSCALLAVLLGVARCRLLLSLARESLVPGDRTTESATYMHDERGRARSYIYIYTCLYTYIQIYIYTYTRMYLCI